MISFLLFLAIGGLLVFTDSALRSELPMLPEGE